MPVDAVLGAQRKGWECLWTVGAEYAAVRVHNKVISLVPSALYNLRRRRKVRKHVRLAVRRGNKGCSNGSDNDRSRVLFSIHHSSFIHKLRVPRGIADGRNCSGASVAIHQEYSAIRRTQVTGNKLRMQLRG